MTTSLQPSSELWTGKFPGLSGAAFQLADRIPSLAGKTFSQHWATLFGQLIENRGDVSAPSNPESVLDLWPGRSRGSWFFTAETAQDVSSETGIDFEPGVIYALLHTRMGGGNRDDYADSIAELQAHPGFLRDYDDSFDCTYANFVYRTDLTKADLERFAAQRTNSSQLSAQKALIGKINSGELAPWAVLAEAQVAAISTKLTLARSNLRSAEYGFSEDQLALAELALEAGDELSSGKPLDDSALVAALDGRRLNDALGIHRGLSTVLEEFKSAAKANAELDRLSEAMAEAEALPEGTALREYLIGDRGTVTIRVTEKQGRRNVTVPKAIERGTLLGSDLNTAKSAANTHRKAVEYSLRAVLERRDALKELELKLAGFLAEVAELEAELWAAGWYKSNPVPAKPTEA